jgi:molybdate transport system substrate-binding protein
MRTGSLDAAIVYQSNTAQSRDELEILPLNTGSLLARQPWAVSRSTDHPNTLSRLLETLVDERSASRFRALGFIWLGDRPVTLQDGAPTP